MDKFGYVGSGDVNAIEELFKKYSQDPSSVDESWRNFFKGLDFARAEYKAASNGSPVAKNTTAIDSHVVKEFNVINLINGYRMRGHLFTKTNPVRNRRKYKPDLGIDVFDLNDSDMETVFQAGVEIEIGPAKLKDIVAHLQQTYCQSIGVEYMNIRNPNLLTWLQERMETTKNIPKFSKDEKTRILN